MATISEQPKTHKPTQRLRLDHATRQKLVPLFMVVFGFTALILVLGEMLGGTEKLRAAVESSGAWAPAVYLLIKAGTYVIAPLSGASSNWPPAPCLVYGPAHC